MPIQLLPISLANQIAAGEVIERPSSVVKELVENSLDAGATEIQVDIEQGGSRRIRIRDNGSGIPQAELALALSRHATSKISNLSDLEAIMSLGFRGEALASISSVSRLTLVSKPAAQAQAWQAWVEGRDMQAQLQPASHPDGTTVDVEDLFFNTPARRKFLRTEKTEFAHIDEVLRRLALARYDVRFSLRHNDKLVRQYPAALEPSQYPQRLNKVLGEAFMQHAQAVDESAAGWRLWGWICAAEHCRHQADWQYFYVNGRMLKDRLLGHAIRQAYGDTLHEERSPSFVLYLELPANEVDVNVHPAKHEVRFVQARQIHDFIYQALRPLVGYQPSAPVADAAPSASFAPPLASHGYRPTAADIAAQLHALQPTSRTPLPGVMEAPPNTIAPTAALSSDAECQLLSVLHGRFGLLLLPAQQLALLDLQRVHQRALAEQLAQQYRTGLAAQPLLIPLQLTAPEVLQQLAATDPQRLAKLGVVVQRQGQKQILQQVPAVLRQTNLATTLPELLQRLTEAPAAPQDLPQSLWLWLAQFMLLKQYSLSNAEHWLQRWRQWQQPAPFLHLLPLPPLPPAVTASIGAGG